MFGVHFCSYLSITLNFALCPSPVFFRCCPTKSYILKTKVTSRNAAFVCVAFQCFRRNLRSHPARPRHRPGTCSLMSTPTQPPSWVCCATSPSCSWWSAMVGSSLLPVLNMQTVAVSPTISRTKLLPWQELRILCIMVYVTLVHSPYQPLSTYMSESLKRIEFV